MEEAKSYVLDLIKSFKTRLANPFVIGFCIAWACWNFRLLLVAFGDGEGGWLAKIQYIDEKLMPTWKSWALHAYMIPAGAALAWIYVLPPVFRAISSHYEKSNSKTIKAIQVATETRALTEEEAVELRATMVNQRAAWLADKAEVVKSLENLTAQNAQAEAVNTRLSGELEAARAEIAALKTPPRPAPPNLSALTTSQRAKLLHIHASETYAADALVLFDAKYIAWPWVVSQDAVHQGPSGMKVSGKTLTEEMVAGMLAMPDIKATTKSEWVAAFRDRRIGNPAQTVSLLLEVGCFNLVGEDCDVNPSGFALARWLKEIGFGLSGLIATG